MKPLVERLQHDFAAALADRASVAAVAAALVARDGRLSERLALYRENAAAAWAKALRSAYPVVLALVGAEFFEALARAYADAYPSTSGDLNHFGAQFAGFVAEFEHTQSLPYLGDVACLEWAVHRARFAADMHPLSHVRITGLSPQQLLATRFCVNPGCAWFGSDFPIATLWRAHQPQTSVGLPDRLDRAEFALVVRPRWQVEVVESNAGEVAALEQLKSGADLQTAMSAALLARAQVDLAGALVRWLELGVLVDASTIVLG